MIQTQPRGKDLFEKIIRVWNRRTNREESLTFNQIANLALGKGDYTNAKHVGLALNEFRDYFRLPQGYGKKASVNWFTVERDYPHLLSRTSIQPVPQPNSTSPIEGMQKALDDEIRAVKIDSEKNPVKALGAHLIGHIDGAFLYEAVLDIETDAELSIPEGVGIKLRWNRGYPYLLEGTLLSYNSLDSTIIFEITHPLTFQHLNNSFLVLPRIEELLIAVKGKIFKLSQDKQALSWRLLNPNLEPAQKKWTNSLIQFGLDSSQLKTVEKCLNHDITYLWGPPGTGKTYTLGRLIASAALAGKKIIATAIANVAVDQLAIGVVKALEEHGKDGERLLTEGRVLRFGHPRLTEVSGEPRLFPDKAEIQRLRKTLHQAQLRHREIPEKESLKKALCQKEIKDLKTSLKNLTKEMLSRSSIVLTTAVQTCIEDAFNETTFDIGIVDEASMMPIPYLVSVGLLGRERFIVAGDFRQLGPIALSRSPMAFEWLHKDGFELIGINCEKLNHAALEMLNTQRRMHLKICDLINKPFYKGELKTEVKDSKMFSQLLPPLPGQPVVFVALRPEDGISVQTTPKGSRFNEKSAEVVIKLATQYVKSQTNMQIGVITPYRAQVGLIKKKIKDMGLSKEQLDRVKIGTIHAFQGSETDIVIWDLVETRFHKIGMLYRGNTGDRLANVAISRAKGKLVIVGDRESFFDAPGAELVMGLRKIIRENINTENTVFLNEINFVKSDRSFK